MRYMKVERIIHDKRVNDSLIIERVVWGLPKASAERPHGLKYRLYCGTRNGRCIVRYDNEHGKGDHRHYAGGIELGYCFSNLTTLLTDFDRDIARLSRGPIP